MCGVACVVLAVVCAGCGFKTPSGPVGDDGGVDGPGMDGSDDSGGTEVCYGPLGAWRVCLPATPIGQQMLMGKIDTDKSPLCVTSQPSGWLPSQPAACVIARDTITVMMKTEVTGVRPLVLVAESQITVTSELDFAGHERDNDNNIDMPPGMCLDFSQEPGGGNDASGGGGGGGGGAGGGFTTLPGNGGQGGGRAEDNRNGQAAPINAGLPTRLRGGCPGQVGGGRNTDEQGAGRGGGALYLVTRGTLTINSAINASGAGGSGGRAHTGGSGGGSGGMIVLHATVFGFGPSGAVLANGGSGASGGTGGAGQNGRDPNPMTPGVAADGPMNAGDGFPATLTVLDGTGGASGSDDGGGGGGGGAGYIRSNNTLLVGRVSPPPSVLP